MQSAAISRIASSRRQRQVEALSRFSTSTALLSPSGLSSPADQGAGFALSSPQMPAHLWKSPASSCKFEDTVESLKSDAVESYATAGRPTSEPVLSPRPTYRRTSEVSITSEPSYPLHLNSLRRGINHKILRDLPPRCSSRNAFVSDYDTSSSSGIQLCSAFSVTTTSLDTSPDYPSPEPPKSHVSAGRDPVKRPIPAPLSIKRTGAIHKASQEQQLSPFQAMLLGEAEAYPVWLEEDCKLVSFIIGGQRFTIGLKSLYSKPSKLAEYVKHVVEEARIRATDAAVYRVEDAARAAILEQPTLAESGSFYQPDSFQEDPLPEDAQDEQIVFGDMSGLYDSEAPLPTPRPRSISASKRPVLVRADSTLQKSAKASISTFDAQPPIEDWTGDYELQESPEPIDKPLPSVPEPKSDKRTTVENVHRLLLEHHRRSGTMASSDMSKQASTGTNVATASVCDDYNSSIAPRQLDDAVTIYLERGPKAYAHIFHYLRFGQLPPFFSYSTTLRTVGMVSDTASKAILALLLHPALAEIEEVRAEAAWLGLSSLVRVCEDTTAELSGVVGLGALQRPTSGSEASVLETARPDDRRKHWI